MAYKYREEIVGKRFLSVCGFTKLKSEKITEWSWRAGVIRAASHKENTHPDLQVLVEYDDVEWHRREWLSIYKEGLFHVFLVEKSLVWGERSDPFAPSNSTVLWPALSFSPLVSSVELDSNQQPLEFLVDRELCFCDYSRLQPFQDWEPGMSRVRDYPELKSAVRHWMEQQDGQRILVTTPSVLVGYRVEVYRAEGTTQWYTAVIVSYNEATRELTVTDDTVLEDHNEDPCIIQMRLIGDGVVESIMRGENVGITPRRSRSSAVLTQHQQQSRINRGAGGPAGRTYNNTPQNHHLNNTSTPAPRKHRVSSPPPAVSPIPVITATDKGKSRAEKKRKVSESERGSARPRDKEDLENKSNRKKSKKKKVLEEADNSKLRRHVEIRIQDCLQLSIRRCEEEVSTHVFKENNQDSKDGKVPSSSSSDESERKEEVEISESKGEEEKSEECEEVPVKKDEEETVLREEESGSSDSAVDKDEGSESETQHESDNAERTGERQNGDDDKSKEETVSSERETEDDCEILPLRPASRDDDEGPSSPLSRMELPSDSSSTALLRFPDDRSDSGVSSLRSGSCASGDERSGSRSSALSSSDEPQTQTTNRSPVFVPTGGEKTQQQTSPQTQQEPVRVWRDPSLILGAEPTVRHITSVQHSSLLMSHPAASAATATPNSVSSAPVSQGLTLGHYGPSPLITPHPLHVPPHLPPPGMYQNLPDMLWKQRYPPLPVGTHLLPQAQPPHPATSAEELLERERAAYQDRERHERLMRERREQEIEKQHKERERVEREKIEKEKQQQQMERERLEKQRAASAAEQAVHKHFEDSLRLMQQKQRNSGATMGWNVINSLPQLHRNSAAEEDRKRAAELDAQQQRMMAAERLRHDTREQQHRPFYPQGHMQRSPVTLSKVEYPPPPAHSRGSGAKTAEKQQTGHTALPKAEPNFSLFGYPPYQPVGFMQHESSKLKQDQLKVSQASSSVPVTVGAKNSTNMCIDRDREVSLSNPPPLMSDLKNSVIVKNNSNNPHHAEVLKLPATHSPSPKMQHYVVQHKNYEYRSPTQSPHHPMPMEPQNLAGKVHHHRVTVQTNQHPHQQRQSPHQVQQQPQPPQQVTHQTQSDQRYSSLPYGITKPATVSSYPYPSLTAVTTGGHSTLNPATVVSIPKPKVSSPAPPHIYGKPLAGISTGIPVCRPPDVTGTAPIPLTSKAPVSPSPYQQMSQHQLPPVAPHSKSLNETPPPAHSKPTIYDQRQYLIPGSSVKSLSHHQSTSPPTGNLAPRPPSRSSPLFHSAATSFQTQPLDLGVSSNREDSSSPKRKSVPMSGNSGAIDCKKKKVEVLTPQLARVSEPSPLVAGAATIITTVVNTAAYCTPAATMVITHSEASPSIITHSANYPPRIPSAESLQRPASTGTCPNVGTPPPVIATLVNQRNSPAPTPPAASVTPVSQSSGTSTPFKQVQTSTADSEKSNSPGPTKTPSTTSSYVHKLKKAWLERHSGEDGLEDTSDIVGSGSCETLPLTIATVPSPATVNISNSILSFQNVGSMAVSSICKTKSGSSTGKVPRKPQIPTSKDSIFNGHTSDLLSLKSRLDDSSSSDQEREHKSPPKRKPPKVKRKKGSSAARKAAAEELKRKKLSAMNSESGSDSDKESGSEKDSDSTGSIKKAANGSGSVSGNNNSSKEPRKRGRRPKATKNERGEEPRQKRPRDDPPAPQRDPFRKPPVSQLKKTGESFLQDGPCFEVAPKLAKCRECRWTPNQRSKNMPNIFCRFYAFRRLRYTKNGQLAIAGFSDPHQDASQEDLRLWLPQPGDPHVDLDLEMSRFLLLQVGDQLCDLLEQEKDSVALHMGEEKTIAWKRVVQGVREMCDVCETTLFNYHWACGKCGFVVCIDCYKGRKNGTIKIWGEAGRDRDDFSWLFCTNRQPHEQEKLMLTQIIAGDSLERLGRLCHEMRALWSIPQYCECDMSKESLQKNTNGICKELLKNMIKNEPLNGLIKQEQNGLEPEKKNGALSKAEETADSSLKWLADLALSNEDKKMGDDSLSSTDSEDDHNGGFSTLRELLIRPSNKPNGNESPSSSPTNSMANTISVQKGTKKSRLDTLDEVISTVIEANVKQDDNNCMGKGSQELKHFVRRYQRPQKGREPLPIRIMTLVESKSMHPDVPHSWLCDGKLLRLNNPNNDSNYRIFQDQWKRGQPVIVSNVTKNLDMNLWLPESFTRDFGDEKNDLVNCMTGNLVPNQPMRKFWEGFDYYSRRLKDDRGNPMLLKLKDWPPGEDFAEMLPSRFSDLMRVLPLTEYTHRTGRLNLASRLPDCFVRPDLGPKMYNAYGSAMHPGKGTTNLHLDISDAVNVMVYVGIPKDRDTDELIKEAYNAIDEAGCDAFTRRRVREPGELPGALWHIYHSRDADKIRDLLNKVALERGARLEPHHDPIHDQSWYLDKELRERLYKEYSVEGYAIVQCLGDAIFIPAGAPHQVRNLHNCIKVAEDFVSPENVSNCFHLTQEFRELSDTHSNHEDKLQIKNIIYHAVKDSLSVLSTYASKLEESNATAEKPAESTENGARTKSCDSTATSDVKVEVKSEGPS